MAVLGEEHPVQSLIDPPSLHRDLLEFAETVSGDTSSEIGIRASERGRTQQMSSVEYAQCALRRS